MEKLTDILNKIAKGQGSKKKPNLSFAEQRNVRRIISQKLEDYDDYDVEWGEDLVTGACCFGGGGCSDMFAGACERHGGTFVGEGTSCGDRYVAFSCDQCYAEYVFCIHCEEHGATVSGEDPIKEGRIINGVRHSDRSFWDASDEARGNCRNSGGNPVDHTVFYECGTDPDGLLDFSKDHNPIDFCESTKGSCCIGIDFQDGCDPVYAGCQDGKTPKECAEIQEFYGRGIVTSFQEDEECIGKYIWRTPENPGVQTERRYTRCFDDHPNDNDPANFFGKCCVDGRPIPVDGWEDGFEDINECKCKKMGQYYPNPNFPVDACDNEVCPGSLQSQNEMVDCCIKFDNGNSSCTRILRCQCNVDYLMENGVLDATVMTNGCNDNPDYGYCNCC